jgi:queuine tRNA-ribosyltransferase
MAFSFEITSTDGAARTGVVTTPHGAIETPAFMPVGTQGAVKALTPAQLDDAGAQVILGNTYHLWLRPGAELIARRGGLHRFNGWSRAILTDSGGFQVFSLADRRTIDADGVSFRSHLDGSARRLTPETAVDIQALLGSDIAMVLDECPAHPSPKETIAASLALTTRWAARCRARLDALRNGETIGGLAPTNRGQVQFGIVQGGVFADLRLESAGQLVPLDFAGYAIGGLSVGEPNEVMYEIVEGVTPVLPVDKPRYLMGVGTPADIVEAVGRGIDMFDCVMPTRNARNGQLFTRQGPMNIKNARFAEDDLPPDPACGCYTCRHFSRAYLRHLYVAGEITGSVLNSIHNVAFYLDTMRQIRHAIAHGTFAAFRRDFLQQLTQRAFAS